MNSKALEVVGSISSNSKISWQTPGRKALFVTLIAAAEKETIKFSVHDWAMVNYGTLSPSKMDDNVFSEFLKVNKSYNHHKVIVNYISHVLVLRTAMFLCL